MRAKIQPSFVVIGVLLFAVGLLLGQQAQRSKFDAYLRVGGVTPMEVSLLRINEDIIRSHMAMDIPTVSYSSACSCFIGRVVVTDELMKSSLDDVRATMLASTEIVRRSLGSEFNQAIKGLTISDRDLKMTFYELNLHNLNQSHDVAEYANGRLIFK
jgi:hypothetical protein